jgi:hypothetical protein
MMPDDGKESTDEVTSAPRNGDVRTRRRQGIIVRSSNPSLGDSGASHLFFFIFSIIRRDI